MTISRVLGALILAALAQGTALAEELVLFTDGRELVVEAVRTEGLSAILELREGGLLAVPFQRITRWTTHGTPEPAVEPVEAAAWRAAAGAYADVIGRAADRHRIDPNLLTAVAQVESAFNPGAVSPVGAQGLLQLMPQTAERFGVQNAFDVAQNVEGGARYLSWLLDRFEGDTRLALAGYNAGEGAVDRHQGIPPYRETRRYVSLVLEGAEVLAAGGR